jgi:hypothetical protein
MDTEPSTQMNSANTKVVVGCTIAVAVPLLLILLVIAGLWLKAFNDVREYKHLTVWQAIAEWHSQSVQEDASLTPDQRERRELNRAARQLACPLVFFVIGGYFVPTLIAIRRKHSQVVAIAALNVFLGWSFVGWVAALIWALVSENPKLLPRSKNGLP